MNSMTNKSEFGEDMGRKHHNKGYSEEPLPELPKVPLTQEQIDSTRDPADVLADKLGNEKLGGEEPKKKKQNPQ